MNGGEIIIQVLSYLIPGVLVGGASYYWLREEKKAVVLVKDLIFYTLTLNILALGLLKFVLNKPNVFVPAVYTGKFMLKYTLFALVLGVFLLALQGVLNSKLHFRQVPAKKRWLDRLLKSLAFLFVFVGALLFYFSRWFIDYFGEITPEQFLFNLSSPIKGTASGMYTEIMQSPLFISLFLVTPFLLLVVYNRYNVEITIGQRQQVLLTRPAITLSLLLVAVLCLGLTSTYAAKKLKLNEVYQAYSQDSSYIEDNYVIPSKESYEFPKKKRNLIHIYLESIENSFFSKDLGGHMATNLMPELAALSEEGIHFSETDKMGGPHQTYGSSWSVASMINMGMGLPLKIPMGGNNYGKSGYFLPGARGIGDILAEEGYEQTIMFGADADFGGLTTYFTDHGHFNIFDVKYARQKGLIPPDYDVWWGFEDDKLYEYAKAEIARLAASGKPFNFTMETADTHFPDGYLSEHAPTPLDSQYANVIAYSTSEAVKLIRWLQEQDYYSDTTILVTGDHLSMDKKFFKTFDPSYHRTVYNLFLNAPLEAAATTNRQFSPVDFFPSTLASMGVKIKDNRLGLGTDLFSTTETLIERDGLEHYNNELGTRSNYYNKEFVSEKKVSNK